MSTVPAAATAPWIRIQDAPSHVGSLVEVRGWLTHRRSSGKVQFLVIRDGTGVMQCVAGVNDVSPEEWEAGGRLTDLSGRRRLITFDIGGTSADIGVVTDGRFSEASARDTWVGGYPVIVPMIDIHTIGAGGGSIAYVDSGGTFKVGPESAGSQPGPAAYGRGGARPTVTDANLVLGRLDEDNFLGGSMALDVAAAGKVIGELAKQLNLDAPAAAEGALTVVNNNMANAIRSRTVQKGIDPREYALVAFGGAGPLHGADVAAMLGISEVIVPPYPGITSAMGLLTTDIKYESLRTVFLVSTDGTSSGSIVTWRQCVPGWRSNSVPMASISARSDSTVPPMPAMSGKAMSFASISRTDRSTRQRSAAPSINSIRCTRQSTVISSPKARSRSSM
jgi:hypothetical protein